MPDSPTARPLDDRAAALALLRWYVEMGADEAIGDVALNRLASPAPLPVPTPGARAPTACSGGPGPRPPATPAPAGRAARPLRRVAGRGGAIGAPPRRDRRLDRRAGRARRRLRRLPAKKNRDKDRLY